MARKTKEPPVVQSTLTTPAAAEALGITSDQFRRLAAKLGIEPTEWYRNPHYRTGPQCPLWPKDTVLALKDGPEVSSLVERTQKMRVAKETKPARRLAVFARRYPDPITAIKPAAEALFSLNRYAKWQKCNSEHKQEIYDLKNRLVKFLFAAGYCTSVNEHQVRREGHPCYGCNESGTSCLRCGGTGWHLPPDYLKYIVFRFQIEGQTYCWHQPDHLVTWQFTISEASAQWVPELEEKPINLSASKFADAKALIRFVLDEAPCPPPLARRETSPPKRRVPLYAPRMDDDDYEYCECYA